MPRGIVIIGFDSALLKAIEAETARRVEQYAIAYIPKRPAGGEPRVTGVKPVDFSGARILLDWNPGSPISARTLVLAAENRLGHINEAIIVCNPPSVCYKAADLKFADVEMVLNDHIKSWIFLVKELTGVFKERGEGTLVMVYPELSVTAGKEEAADLLGSTALASFRSFTRSLLAASLNEPYLTLGFAGTEAGDETGFAAFIFKQLEEASQRNNGKLYKYGKLGFFK
jgi:hypothetical protein